MDFKLKPINIEFQNLTYTVSKRKSESKQVLKGVSGCFKSGELTAIMGPSGAGKSSLLNILTGFTRGGVSGEVNMKSAKKGIKTNRKHCSYILQNDNLYQTFNVQETMMFAASLKIAGVSLEEKEIIIDNVLNTLHLIHTKNTRCGALSGGQRKRLSIALELLDNPPVLFLDEPTTGLDSSSSAYCVRLLHNLSREGRTIVCTIHTPAATVYEMFDHVYLLSDGFCLYQGSSGNTVPYLSSIGLNCPQYHNPADFLLEVANCDYGNFIPQMSKAAMDNDRWRMSSSYITNTNTESPIAPIEQFEMEPIVKSASGDGGGGGSGGYHAVASRVDSNDSREMFAKPSEWTKFWVLVGRCHIHYYRDWTASHLKLALHISTAILVGLLYGNSGINATKSIANIGLLLIGVAYLWYTTLMPSILKFPLEIAILRKETFNNWYKIRTYFLASLVTTTPLHVLFATVFSTIVFFLTEQPVEIERYLKFNLVYILITILADGIGLTLGSICDPVNGTFFGAIISAFKVAFCGFLALHSHISKPMQLVSYLSSISYTLEALVLAVYDYNRADMICPKEEMYCHYKQAKMVISELGMKPKNFENDVAVMIGQIILFKFVSYYTLKRRLKSDS